VPDKLCVADAVLDECPRFETTSAVNEAGASFFAAASSIFGVTLDRRPRHGECCKGCMVVTPVDLPKHRADQGDSCKASRVDRGGAISKCRQSREALRRPMARMTHRPCLPSGQARMPGQSVDMETP
jgi:hypothetical protein